MTEALLGRGQRGAEAQLPAAARDRRADRHLRARRARGPQRPAQLATRFEGGKLRGAKWPVQDGAVAGLLLVVARDGGRTRARARRDPTAGRRGDAARLARPSRPLARVALRRRARGAARRTAAATRRCSRICSTARRVLTAFEQIGGAERALEVTREFTLGPLRVRASGRVVPGAQAPHGRRLRGDRSWRRRTPTTAPGRSRRATPSSATAACASRAAASDAFELAAHRDDPDVRRRRLHLGVRLPSLLPPREAARRLARQRRPSGATSSCMRLAAEELGSPWTSTTPPKRRRSAPRRARWLDANAERLAPGRAPREPARRRGPQGPAGARARLAGARRPTRSGPASPGRPSTAVAAPPRIQNVIWDQEEANATTCRRTCSRSATACSARRSWRTARRRRSSATCSRCCAPTRSGASSSASRPRAPTSRACAPAPCATASDWVLNGQKIWTSGAHYCKWGMIVTGARWRPHKPAPGPRRPRRR